MSIIQHALGRAAIHAHGYASRVAHAALAEFLEGVYGSARTLAARMEALLV